MSDPSTLLQTTACLCGVSALAIWTGTRTLGFSRKAGHDWALANLLFAVGSLLTLLRERWPEPVLFPLADGLELMGFALLHAGLLRFLGVAPPRREHIGLLAASVVGISAAYAADMPVLRLSIYCSAAAWLLGRAATATYHGLRAEFGAPAAWALTAPMAWASALQLARGIGGLMDGGAVLANALRPEPFNVVLMWAAFVIALLLNFSIAGFAAARQLAHIRELTLRDALTGALNRRALEKLLQREMAVWRRQGGTFALVYFDLDGFKALNDLHGHAVGDRVLTHVSQVIDAACREGDVLARIGGEEFCVLLPSTVLEGACLMAERMRKLLESTPLLWEKQAFCVTASFGVAVPGAVQEGTEQILRRADAAMYEAKRNGRNCVVASPVADSIAAGEASNEPRGPA